jgi:putative tricarboxylic transport membrane protein
LAILLVAGGYLWEAHNVPDLFQMPGVPGPTTFPYLLGIIFAFAGLWLLVSPADLLAHRRQPAAEGRAEERPIPATGLWTRLTTDWHFYTMWIVVVGYLAFMPFVGFPVATFVLLVVFTFLLGEKRWWVVLGLALVVTTVIHLGFAKGLNVRLPLGVLESLLK